MNKYLLTANLISSSPKTHIKIVSKYPGTQSGDLFEHIVSWLHGAGTWKDSKGKFRNF